MRPSKAGGAGLPSESRHHEAAIAISCPILQAHDRAASAGQICALGEMANMMLKSDFMGEALRTGSQAPRPAAALPAQALFGKKAPKQAEKAGSQAKGGAQKAVKQAQKSLPSLPNFGGGAKKAAKETQKKAGGGGGGFKLPNLGGQAKKAGSQAKKATSKGPAKKAGSQAKKASNQASKATKGWLGGAGGAKNLDKFYGAYHTGLCRLLLAPSVQGGPPSGVAL